MKRVVSSYVHNFPDTDTRFLAVRIAFPIDHLTSDYDRPERFTLEITSV